MNNEQYQIYTEILEQELVPAMGCTEPIAISYAGALVRETLGAMPECVKVYASANIIKNVKSVIVPNTGGKKGIEAAVAVGIVAGDASKKLEVISAVGEDQHAAIDEFLQTASITVEQSEKPYVFDIQVEASLKEDIAYVEISGSHTNVICLKRNNTIFEEKEYIESTNTDERYELLNVADIVEYANTVDITSVKAVLDRQISYNMAIAEEGMNNKWGANIGVTLLRSYGNQVSNRAKAYAAAGSDARMSGCELPVVINSGSGNQGMSASIPVIVYARELNASQEQLYRALLVSNLITIHLKTGIGRLSAYCGATSAGCGAGAGICHLHGGGFNEIAHTIVNAVAINSGMVCDGAKSSCAAKIASAVEAGLLGWNMQRQGTEFLGGDGIVTKGVENTIRNVGMMAREGMAETDRVIINIMMHGSV